MAFDDAIQKVNVPSGDVLEHRDAKLFQSQGEEGVNYAGYLVLTKDKLLFVSEKGLLTQAKIRYEVPVLKIQRISKLPLVNQYMIFANTAEKQAGFFKKMFSSKNAQLSIKDAKSFFEKMKEVNPQIQL